MAGTAESVDRLYDLYQQHIDRLRRDVSAVNRSLGSSKPEETRLKPLTRAEFEALLNRPTDDLEGRRLWLRRITRGQGHDVSGRRAQADLRCAEDVEPDDRGSGEHRRRTGT